MTTTLRIDDDLKRDCDKVFEELGLNMTSALTVFLKQVVRTRTIPFIIGEYQTPAAPSSRKLDGQREIRSYRHKCTCVRPNDAP